MLNGGRHCCRPPLHRHLPIRCRTSSDWHGGLVTIASDPSCSAGTRRSVKRDFSFLVPTSAGRPPQGLDEGALRQPSIHFGRSFKPRQLARHPRLRSDSRTAPKRRLTVPRQWLHFGIQAFRQNTPQRPRPLQILDFSRLFTVSMLEWCHAFRVAPRAIRHRNAMRPIKIVDGCG